MQKEPTLEKIIKYTFPAWALKRQHARFELSAQTKGGYEAANTADATFKNFLTFLTSADSSVDGTRGYLVERTRDSIRNNPVAQGVTNRICDHAIGNKGLTLHSQIDREYLGFSADQAADWQRQAEQEFRFFAESYNCDYYKTLNFAEQTYLTLKSKLEGGDCFTLLTSNTEGSQYNLALQNLEGEYVSNPNQGINTATLTDGIQKTVTGVPKACWFSRYHAGDKINFNSGSDWTSRPIFNKQGRKQILHHFNQIRFGQSRGIPVLGPVLGKLLQLKRLSDAELLAAIINSYYALVMTGEAKNTAPRDKNPTKATVEDVEKWNLGAGTIIQAKPGTKVESFYSQRPHAGFEPFFKSVVTEIGAATGVPRSLILMQFDQSYSASRGEVLLAWVKFLEERTNTYVNFCQPVYEAVIDEAVMKGYIKAPGYLASERTRRAYLGSPYNQWTGPTRPAIDEMKEANAHAKYHELGVKSLQEITAETTGKDWVRVNDQLQREHELRVKAGLEEKLTEDEEQIFNEEP